MMRKLFVIGITALLILGCSGMGRPDCSDLWLSQKHIVFSIENTSESYKYGEPIPIKALFANKGNDIAYLELNEMYTDGPRAEWPPGILVCLKSPNGNVLTANNRDPVLTDSRFWSFIFFNSTIDPDRERGKYCCLQKGDCVKIPAGESIERIIPIDKLLRCCRKLNYPLPSGRYLVQLRLGHLYSNEIEI